jgi:hypothetical protein
MPVAHGFSSQFTLQNGVVKVANTDDESNWSATSERNLGPTGKCTGAQGTSRFDYPYCRSSNFGSQTRSTRAKTAVIHRRNLAKIRLRLIFDDYASKPPRDLGEVFSRNGA